MSSNFRWSLPSTAVFKVCASLACKPLSNRQPYRCGPYRNSRPSRATATATSPSERRLCSGSRVLTVHPSASEPAHITRQCAAGRSTYLVDYPCRRSCMFLPLTSASWNQPSLLPSTGLAPTCPLYVFNNRIRIIRSRLHQGTRTTTS